MAKEKKNPNNISNILVLPKATLSQKRILSFTVVLDDNKCDRMINF